MPVSSAKRQNTKADQETFELVAAIARLVERIVQRAHDLGSENIYRVLIAENPPLLAGDEAKILYVIRQLREPEAHRPVRRDVEIVKLEILKIRQENIARQLVLLEARKIIERLPSRGHQAASGGLLLDEKLALPEKIEITPLFLGQVDAMLEACDAPPGNAEQLEKFIVKGVRLAPLVMGAVPILGEFRRAGLDVVPVEAHGLSQIVDAPPILKCPGSSRQTILRPDHRHSRLAPALSFR